MDLFVVKALPILVHSNQIFVKDCSSKKVGSWGTFETGAYLDHPIHHFCAVLPRYIMTFNWISYSLGWLLFVVAVKKLDVFKKFLLLESLLDVLKTLAVELSRLNSVII